MHAIAKFDVFIQRVMFGSDMADYVLSLHACTLLWYVTGGMKSRELAMCHLAVLAIVAWCMKQCTVGACVSSVAGTGETPWSVL